eukprot:GDKI01046646.1.p1 GENE.GDKI01046646.1~~GDKI01046646.1.p1  ORF type:complete len:241 (+),score=30.70 GDKI01046646.1:100-822(+)
MLRFYRASFRSAPFLRSKLISFGHSVAIRNFTTSKVHKAEDQYTPNTLAGSPICSVPKHAIPSVMELKVHFYTAAVPMVGFGLMDNLVMIQAGELIDESIGVAFGLSTLTAAACGQIFSDMSGVCFGGVIDALASKLGLPQVHFTPQQAKMSIVKFVGTCGRAIGVFCGCLLGMSSLLFMDLDKTEMMKRRSELSVVINAVARQAERMINCSCSVFLVEIDNETGERTLLEVEPPPPRRM